MAYEPKDYSSAPEGGNSHYNGVSSWYGEHAMKQYGQIPKYCEPGMCGDEMKGAKRNSQVGPKV